MSANVEWAKPTVTECYAFNGRLYRSLKKAILEQRFYAKNVAAHGDKMVYWRDFDLTIHKVTLGWEAVNEEA